MSTLTEIESAVEALPPREQEELLRHLMARLGESERSKRQLPLAPRTGYPITQKDIDDALDDDD